MRKLTIIERTFTWPDGEADEPDYDEPTFDENVIEPDEFDIEDGKTHIHLTADIIIDKGCTEPSSSPGPWRAGTWFSYIDGSYDSNYYTGEKTEVSCHLDGFTDIEVDAIAAIVTDIACAYPEVM